jgi:hypothetical protein
VIISNIAYLQSVHQKLVDTTTFAVQAADLKTPVHDGQSFVYFGEALVLHPRSQEVAFFEVVVFRRCFNLVTETFLLLLLFSLFNGFLPILWSEMDENTGLSAFNWLIGCHPNSYRLIIINGYNLYR